MHPIVSIIIVNYNTKELIINCIESIYAKVEALAFELIVVDNASIDGSEEAIVAKFPDLIFIQSGDNIGFGRANNLGIAQAKGKYIFLLNSDTILINNAVKILADYLQNNPKVAVCGGNLYDTNLHPMNSFCRTMPSLGMEIHHWTWKLYNFICYGKNYKFNHTQKPLLIKGHITGADMMIRKSVLDEVGVFDPDFFMYYEETELIWRMRKRGYLIASVPEAKIIHLEGGSESFSENTFRRGNQSKFLYFLKTNQLLTLRFVYLAYETRCRLKIIRYSLFGKKEKKKRSKYRLMIHKQEYDRIKNRMK